ncbi:hypothetical protein VCAG7404_001176A, partial [Vibrio cholerae O1 str. AG-7404]
METRFGAGGGGSLIW